LYASKPKSLKPYELPYKKYLILTVYSLVMILINYISGYGFIGSTGEIVIFVQGINTVLFPLLLSYYSYSATKTSGNKSFAVQGCFIIICYLSTYIIPSLKYFSFQTFSFAMDGHGKALFTIIIGFGLVISLIAILSFQYLLLRRSNSQSI
jgi:hypothetical protein